MLHGTDFLHLRPHGYVWRRRVPIRCQNFFSVAFLSFSLRTHVLLDAAERGRRITGLSDLCFDAETDMPPEEMTQLLTEYARFEIEAADRLRALTGRRTRQAAEVALSIEAATRASLRDAIFLGDHSIAAAPIHDTAARLGIKLDETEEDYAILADRMIRLMIEVSEERERRSRGIFSDPQPYLRAALQGLSEPVALIVAAPGIPPTAFQEVSAPKSPASIPQEDKIKIARPDAPEGVVVAGEELTVTYAAPNAERQGRPLTLLPVWDLWFEARTARRFLMGHKNTDIGIVNYLPEGFPLSTLKTYIEKLRIDLSPITRRFSQAEQPRGPRLATIGGRRMTA